MDYGINLSEMYTKTLVDGLIRQQNTGELALKI
jgi:hypothetical protein